MSGNIIETIDEALHDWTVSGDAMRWTPDSGAVRPRPIAPRLATITIRPDFQPFVAAMQKMAEALKRIDLSALKRLTDALAPPRPPHQPRPLRIDGRAYHQRQRNRKRRR